MMRRRVNRDTKHIIYSNMSGELKSVLEDGPIEGEPFVSVCVITYNHGKYIRQCLDGILMQKVNFPYEILIHDDASPDDTADIIREYWEKYPTVIKPILRTENQYSKGVDVCRFNFDRAKAKYIAQCEGDDYWIDDGKLQMQVDFLEEHGEYVACVHRVRVVDENNQDDCASIFSRDYDTTIFTLDDAQKYNICTGVAGHFSSTVYKNLFQSSHESIVNSYYNTHAHGDRKLSLYLTLNGNVYRFDETMSTYRHITSTGTSWSARSNYLSNFILLNVLQLNELERFAKEAYNVTLNYDMSKSFCFLVSIYYLICRRNMASLSELIGIIKLMTPKQIILSPICLFQNRKKAIFHLKNKFNVDFS